MPCWISGPTTPMLTRCHSRLSLKSLADRGAFSLLMRNDVVDRLATLEDVTGGKLRWSESAGLKQVVRNFDITKEIALSYISSDYNGLTVEEKIS